MPKHAERARETGTGELSVVEKVVNFVKTNTGLSGNAAREIEGRPGNVDRQVDEIVKPEKKDDE